jgi:soluble lytic murein transglycosylase-like protein
MLPGSGPFNPSKRSLRLSQPPSDAAPQPEAIQSVALDAAREHRVDPAMVLSVLESESEFREDALSPSGAVGLMQVMPETARELGYDPANWQENIQAGTMYLGMLLSRYHHRSNCVELALAAYNAGPAAVARHRGVPPYRETRQYVRRVMARYRTAKGAVPERRHRSDHLLLSD